MKTGAVGTAVPQPVQWGLHDMRHRLRPREQVPSFLTPKAEACYSLCLALGRKGLACAVWEERLGRPPPPPRSLVSSPSRLSLTGLCSLLCAFPACAPKAPAHSAAPPAVPGPRVAPSFSPRLLALWARKGQRKG